MALTSCVPVPPEMLPQAPAVGGAAQPAVTFGDLDAGGVSMNSLHFTLRGYNETDLRNLSSTAEDLYNKIGNDTGLYSFLASGNFAIVVYRDQNEYLQKAHQPAGSRAISSGKTVYAYPGPDLAPELAHHLTHAIFNAYMEGKAVPLAWLNEGIAVREETDQMLYNDRADYLAAVAAQLRKEKQPFQQMMFFVPRTEADRRKDAWYQQVGSVVSYLMSQNGATAFGGFLNALRMGTDIDHAIADSYAARFRSLADLETAWRNAN